MAITINVVQDWTGPLDFRLEADGSAVDLTGTTPLLILSEENGASITLAGTSALLTATGGTVRFTPATGDLIKGGYRGRWKITDGSSNDVYFPNEEADTWKVRYP
jgi:hypothetical protein